MTPVVEIDQLRRVYNFTTRAGSARNRSTVIALDDISMTVSQGEIVGLLGPNGAGKTTLIKVLSTVLLPTSGSVRVLGCDVVRDAQQVRQRCGIVFGGERGLYGRLTVRNNLEYWSGMYHVPRRARRVRIPALLNKMGLSEHAGKPVDRLSRGMKQRLHLARGLVHDPELIIMDEPTSGLDPVAAREFRSLVEDFRRAGRTVLLATHDLAEAEQLCDRVVMIDRGRICGTEHPKEVGRWLAAYERIEARGADDGLLAQVRGIAGAGQIEDIGDGWHRIHITSDSASPLVLKLLVDSGITSLRTSLPSLEDVYFHIIGDRGIAV
jgi:ABC-2 type transport system ATP-binding protein